VVCAQTAKGNIYIYILTRISQGDSREISIGRGARGDDRRSAAAPAAQGCGCNSAQCTGGPWIAGVSRPAISQTPFPAGDQRLGRLGALGFRD